MHVGWNTCAPFRWQPGRVASHCRSSGTIQYSRIYSSLSTNCNRVQDFTNYLRLFEKCALLAVRLQSLTLSRVLPLPTRPGSGGHLVLDGLQHHPELALQTGQTTLRRDGEAEALQDPRQDEEELHLGQGLAQTHPGPRPEGQVAGGGDDHRRAVTVQEAAWRRTSTESMCHASVNEEQTRIFFFEMKSDKSIIGIKQVVGPVGVSEEAGYQSASPGSNTSGFCHSLSSWCRDHRLMTMRVPFLTVKSPMLQTHRRVDQRAVHKSE